MPEAEKVEHLFKGIAENPLSVISPKSPSTLKDFVAHAKQYDELLYRHIFEAPFTVVPEIIRQLQ